MRTIAHDLGVIYLPHTAMYPISVKGDVEGQNNRSHREIIASLGSSEVLEGLRASMIPLDSYTAAQCKIK